MKNLFSRARLQNAVEIYNAKAQFVRGKADLGKYFGLITKPLAELNKLGLFAEPFSMTSFERICRRENISLSRRARPAAVNTGEYRINLLTGKSSIWLSPNLSPSMVLFVAAHELGHYFLHRREMMQGSFPNPISFKAGELPLCLQYGEVQADLFASLLLSSEAKDEK